MTCFFPRDAWRGKVNENGKRPVVFNRSDSESRGFGDALQVPCGKCAGCRADRALAWSIRSYQEASLYPQNSFITLTYSDEHLPEKLVKKDLQDFFREIRKQDIPIRYYACGEYGDRTNRPHYHALIFGQDFRFGTEVKIDDQMYMVPELSEIWGKGFVTCSDFSMATACYVAGYVGKKIGSECDSFQIMSRKPGIGFNWLRKFYRDIQKTNSVIIEGQEFPVPAAYIRWAEENMNNELKGVKEYRQKRMAKMPIEKIIDRRREAKAKQTHAEQRIQHQKQKEKI